MDIGLIVFLGFLDLNFILVHNNAKREPGQYAAILTLRLVINIYVLMFDTNSYSAN